MGFDAGGSVEGDLTYLEQGFSTVSSKFPRFVSEGSGLGESGHGGIDCFGSLRVRVVGERREVVWVMLISNCDGAERRRSGHLA